MDYVAITTNNYLEHHGILGQKWGIRRFQNKDGTLTAAGKRRLNKDAKQLGYYQSEINKNQALARVEKNPTRSMMYEWGQQFKYEQYFDELYAKMKDKYGSDNIKDIENNPNYKKTAEIGKKWFELSVNMKSEDLHSIEDIFTQFQKTKSPFYMPSNKKYDEDMYEFVKGRIEKK